MLRSWQEPYTTWLETDRCTYADINRIAGNLNYLLDDDALKADYTQDDVITMEEWTDIVDAVIGLVESEGLYNVEELPNTDATALNFNIVEGLTHEIKAWIDLKAKQLDAAAYTGEAIYVNDYDLFVR